MQISYKYNVERITIKTSINQEVEFEDIKKDISVIIY